MTASSELAASPRTVLGKASRRLGSAGQIPAVVYGLGRDAAPIALDRHDFEVWYGHHGAGGVVELTLEGEKKPLNVMIREVQHSAVKGRVLHIDFLAVSMTELINSVTTLHLVNDPEGVKAGGVLNVAVHELNVEALPGDLTESIEVDVAGLGMGESLHIKDIVPPAGVTILDDPELLVASVIAPRSETEEELGEEAAAEPEVIGAKGDEE